MDIQSLTKEQRIQAAIEAGKERTKAARLAAEKKLVEQKTYFREITRNRGSKIEIDAPHPPKSSKRTRSDSFDGEGERTEILKARMTGNIPVALTASNLSSLKVGRKQRDSVAEASSPLSEAQAQQEVSVAPINSAISRQLPGWYERVPCGRNINRSLSARLQQPYGFIKDCRDPTKSHSLMVNFQRIREELHTMMFHDVLTKEWKPAVKHARILEDKYGLPRLFDKNLMRADKVEYPWDISADAQELYNKWVKADFKVDLLRGIITGSKQGKKGIEKRNSDKIDKNFENLVPWNFFGAGNLVNGQWWPTQLCTIRDGAHGSSQGGIAGIKGKGATSIVLSGGNSYNDRDEGDEIWYSGTDGENGIPTENTKRLVESAVGYTDEENGQYVKHPVRVIRSHNLASTKNAYRPSKGFRYDGLYDVLPDYQVVDETKQIHRFHLKRCSGQDPIRYAGDEARPTRQEIAEYGKIRAQILD